MGNRKTNLINRSMGLAARLRADMLGRGDRSYSQCGEDIFLLHECYLPQRGTYVDVGAGHPYFGSNSYLFYRRGWQGLTIDPNPDHARLHRIIRPRDTFQQLGVSQTEAKLEYFKFNNPDFNTFDADARDRAVSHGGVLKDTDTIPVRPLATLLAENGIQSDFDMLSVDCEGLDVDVLMSNDWKTYRPRIVLVEDLETIDRPFQVTKVHEVMTGFDYRRRATVGYTSIYQANERR
ncbi:MAG: FkbM family methyltransferase [Pseudomonadota bacterium]